MTAANLKPEWPVAAALADQEPPSGSLASPDAEASPVGPLTRPGAGAAADSDAAASQDEIRNPLWIVAIGMACMFGVMAFVIALG